MTIGIRCCHSSTMALTSFLFFQVQHNCSVYRMDRISLCSCNYELFRTEHSAQKQIGVTRIGKAFLAYHQTPMLHFPLPHSNVRKVRHAQPADHVSLVPRESLWGFGIGPRHPNAQDDSLWSLPFQLIPYRAPARSVVLRAGIPLVSRGCPLQLWFIFRNRVSPTTLSTVMKLVPAKRC